MRIAKLASSPLRGSLVIPGAIIMVALCLGLIGVGYWSRNSIVNSMAEQLIRHRTISVQNHVSMMMDAPSKMLTRVRNSVARHQIDLTDPPALASELYALLRDEPDVDWLYFANEMGGIVSTGRLGDGTQVILMTDAFQAGVIREYNASPDGRMTTLRKSGAYFDPRGRGWYKTAKKTRMSFWTKPYIGAIEPILGISFSAPVVGEKGEIVGVYGLDLILTRLSDYMRRQRLGTTGRVFLIDEDGFLIASSGGVLPVTVDAAGRQQRLRPEDARDSVVGAAGRHLSRRIENVTPSKEAGIESFVFEDEDLGRIFAGVTFFRLPGGRSWLIVSALPATDFLGTFRKVDYLSIVLVTLLVFASLVVGVWNIDRALRPLYSLATAAHEIAGGGWPDVPEIHRTDEIGVLAQALGKMTQSLQKIYEELEQRVEERTKELSEANAKLKELDQLKSSFLAIMSHELRTPLNSILGFTGIMLQGLVGPLNDEQRFQLNMVKSSGRHLLDLINDILDLSKIEAGKLELYPEPIDMRRLIEKTVQTLKPLAEKKKLELVTAIAPEVKEVFSDRRRVEQILINLINNAIKFTDEGQVFVESRVRDGWLRTSVVDTGIGINSEDMNNLFTPFRQLDNGLTRRHEGTGLGLMICRKLLDLLGGEISVESTLGVGSSFTFTLPLNRPEEEHEKADSELTINKYRE